jgi:hypothetical protein
MWWAELAKAAWVATLARDRFQPGGVMADRAGMRRPGTITLATTVMVIRAVLGLLGIVLVFVVKDDIRQAIENSDHGLSAAEVDTATNLAVGIALVFAALVSSSIYGLRRRSVADETGRGLRPSSSPRSAC